MVIEPLPWLGNIQKAIDPTNLGKYFFEVQDSRSGKALYSRGFASIYGEWEDTDEAAKSSRTFEESVRFPEPDKSFVLILKKRDAQNQWKEIYRTTLDPKNMFV